MRIGDVVVPIKGKILHSGTDRYTHAICISINPFVLVSEEADMRWQYTINPLDFLFLCQAHPYIVTRCMSRL